MRAYRSDWITVVSVLNQRGYDTTGQTGLRMSQVVGTKMREAWMTATATEPHAELRPKTRGGGTHFKCVYPPAWRQQIEAIIDEVAPSIDPALSNQLSLFGA